MRTLVAIIAFTLVACVPAHPAVDPLAAVQVTTHREAVEGCTPLGLVEASDPTTAGVIDQRPTVQDSYRLLQKDAKKLGANIVVLSDTPQYLTRDHLLRGEAFKCAYIR